MKFANDYSIDDIKKHLHKLQRKNTERNVIFIILGITILIFGIIYAVLKFKDKFIWGDFGDFDDDSEYSSDDETYEDYRALDYMDEEEEE